MFRKRKFEHELSATPMEWAEEATALCSESLSWLVTFKSYKSFQQDQLNSSVERSDAARAATSGLKAVMERDVPPYAYDYGARFRRKR